MGLGASTDSLRVLEGKSRVERPTGTGQGHSPDECSTLTGLCANSCRGETLGPVPLPEKTSQPSLRADFRPAPGS